MAFMSHVMYMRQQVPQPVSIILSDLKSSIVTDRNMRKQILFANTFNEMSTQVQQICDNYVISSTSVIIGPTITSSREIYKLNFISTVSCNTPLSLEHDHRSDEITSDRMVANVVHKLLRTLVAHWSECADLRVPNIQNTFLALNILQRKCAIKSSPGTSTADIPSTSSTFGDSTSAFVLRENLKLKTRRKAPPQLNVQVFVPVRKARRSNEQSSPSPVESTTPSMKEDSVTRDGEHVWGQWLVLRRGLKGLRVRPSRGGGNSSSIL